MVIYSETIIVSPNCLNYVHDHKKVKSTLTAKQFMVNELRLLTFLKKKAAAKYVSDSP